MAFLYMTFGILGQIVPKMLKEDDIKLVMLTFHTFLKINDSCLQFWGGMGFTNDVEISRSYR